MPTWLLHCGPPPGLGRLPSVPEALGLIYFTVTSCLLWASPYAWSFHTHNLNHSHSDRSCLPTLLK